MGKPYVRREAQLKAEVLQIVERSPLPVRQTLQELQIAPSTYYRWKSRYRDKGFNGLVETGHQSPGECGTGWLQSKDGTWSGMRWSTHR